ncbi:MAG TPA: T9SS type A sorting domain-containing protein [Chryseolinea sp.]|nr:T9SS type A sorting domain-containing protein [Chryseolinea sp.]
MPRFLRLVLLIAFGVAVFSSASQATNYYTYTSAATSGAWNVAGTWTTDPSGVSLTGSAVPASGDAVFILNGFTVFLTSGVATTGHSITINNGGTLDMATFSISTLNSLAGNGTLRIKWGYFPTVTSNTFVNNAASGATVEYDFDGIVPASFNFPNLKFINTTSANRTIALSNPVAYTLNVYGSLSTQVSGSGSLTLTLGTEGANVISLVIGGSVTIGSGTTWNTGLFNAIHNVSISGDMTNNGTVTFSNTAAYAASANGAAVLTFAGTTDNVLACNNITNLYTLAVNKGTSSTYTLSVTSTNVANLSFRANDILLNVTNGTLRLGPNINLPRIRQGGNYELGSPTSSPMLWVDGATVNANTSALVVYGKFRITAGSFTTTGGEGSVIRNEGQYLIEGGTFTTEKFRPSTTEADHRGSFIMTGGVFNATGTSGSNASYARFSHPFKDQVFIMTGGIINVTNPQTGNEAGLHIGVKESNYTVTGGTINITLSGTAGACRILSTVPIYDLNISRSTTGTPPTTAILADIPMTGAIGQSEMTTTAQPLRVLNNLTMSTTGSPILSANNQHVTVGGDFTISTGATYTPGSNTTTFNGSGTQQFSNSGTITTGLHNLTVNKSAGTLTLGGSATSYTVINTLTLTSGVLNDGGKVIQVTGNIVNSATHTGTGSITLSGGGTQTLSGDGNGTYGNVVLNNGNSPGVTATANLSISGTLTLAGTGNSLFDINQYTLSMTSNSVTALTTTGNAFSNAKMVRTLGLQSDGGLRKTFGNLLPFTYAVGAAGVYTPAVIQLTAAPTSYGSITVKPVNSRDPFVVAGNTNNLTWYWRVASSGFVGSATYTHKYYYDETSVSPTNDDATYIPARYTPTIWTVINDLTQVNETTNEITFANVTYVDGDFTAGRSAAFGTVKVFYSKRNGDWFNVTAGVTPWSNVSHSGADATTSPGPGDHVYVGDGVTYNHTIAVSADNANAGGLEISSGSTLDVGVFTGHNFGALEDAPIGGSGTLRISSNTATAQFPAGDFGNFIRASGGTVVYYSTGAQNFEVPLSSATPTFLPLITYRNLVLQPAAGRTITLPNLDIRIFGDLSVQGAAASAIVLFNGASARSFTVNGNVSITGGVLQLQNGFAQSVDVDGNISLGNGASFNLASTGTAVTNFLTIDGSVANDGSFDMSNGTRICNVTFGGNTNASVTGAGAVTDFNVLTVSKGTSITPILEVNAANFSLSGGATPLILTNGTFRLTSTQAVAIANGSDFNIPATSRLSANGGTLQITGNDGIDLLLAGTLEVLAGTVSVGTTNNDNSIEYASTGLPTITATGGTLNVRAQVRRSAANAQGTLAYNQSGLSTVNVGIFSALTTTRSLFELFGTGSTFSMSGGVLSLQRAVTAGITEFFLQPSSGSMTGGTIEVGTGATGQLIDLNTTIPLFNLSAIGTNNTANLLVNTLTLRGSLSIAAGCVFAANSLNVTIAGNFSNANTTSTTGTTVGGYRVGGVTQTTTFNGSAANESITGASGNLTNFGNLIINNTFSGGSVMLQPNSNLRVHGNLTISSGTLAGVANTVSVLGSVSNSSTHTSTTGTITLASTLSPQLITGNGLGKFGNLVVNNGALGAYFGANQEITGTLTLTASSLLIGSYSLNLSNPSLSSIVGASATVYIMTSGNLSDGGVIKAFAAGVSNGNFIYPVGVSGKYTPADYTLSTGSGGTMTVRPVNNKHPSATGSGTAFIRYYWNVATSGIAITSFTHRYTYAAADQNGTVTDYRDARFTGGAWFVGSTANVNTGTRVITFVNSTNVASDYTAGEPTAFVNPGTYTSIGSGAWESDAAVWSPDPPGNGLGPPPGSFIIISDGTTVTVGASAKSVATTSIQGQLNLGSTNSHNFGTVSTAGTGLRTMQLQTSFFPAGDFSAFNGTSGGTVEYNGPVTLSATQATYNNLSFTGTGVKELGNVDLIVNGNVSIAAGTVNNTVNRSINMVNTAGDFTNNGIFNAGSGSITIGRDLFNSGAGATFNAPNSTTGLKVMRNLTNGTGASFIAGTDSVGVRGTLVNSGTFTAGGNALRVNGNLQNTGGTFTTAAGTVYVGSTLTNSAPFSAGTGAITVQGQFVNSGASAAYAANANSLFVNGFINLSANSTFNAGTGQITLNGHWNNSATFTAGTGTTNFTGAANQNVNGATTFYNVGRSGGGNLILNNDVIMSGLLSLSTGNIVTGTNVLSLINTSSQPVTGYSPAAYIDGGLSITYPNTALASRVYPIANAGAYRPVTIQQTLAFTSSVVLVRMTNTPPTGTAPAGVDRLSQARYFAINLLSGTMNSPTVDLSFNTNGTADETIATPTNARVLRSATAPSGPWTNEGGSGVFAPADPAGHVTSGTTSFTSGTYFALGYPNEITPVTLVSFSASLHSDMVALSWATASEINNHYFTIERSDERLQFDSLFSVAGAGDSQLLLHYQAMDYSPLQGVSFYRLKQTDYDLKYTYSRVVRVVNNPTSGQVLSLYPNPVWADNKIQLRLNTNKAEESYVLITDVLGRVYFAGAVDLSKSTDVLDLALNYRLGPGTYVVRVSWGNKAETRKLIVH